MDVGSLQLLGHEGDVARIDADTGKIVFLGLIAEALYRRQSGRHLQHGVVNILSITLIESHIITSLIFQFNDNKKPVFLQQETGENAFDFQLPL